LAVVQARTSAFEPRSNRCAGPGASVFENVPSCSTTPAPCSESSAGERQRSFTAEAELAVRIVLEDRDAMPRRELHELLATRERERRALRIVEVRYEVDELWFATCDERFELLDAHAIVVASHHLEIRPRSR